MGLSEALRETLWRSGHGVCFAHDMIRNTGMVSTVYKYQIVYVYSDITRLYDGI